MFGLGADGRCPALPPFLQLRLGFACCADVLVAHCSFADCDKNTINGCEVNIGGDANNCGGCGKVATLPNATAICSGGQAAISSCVAGWVLAMGT
jgi:hypothetical protein